MESVLFNFRLQSWFHVCMKIKDVAGVRTIQFLIPRTLSLWLCFGLWGTGIMLTPSDKHINCVLSTDLFIVLSCITERGGHPLELLGWVGRFTGQLVLGVQQVGVQSHDAKSRPNQGRVIAPCTQPPQNLLE